MKYICFANVISIWRSLVRLLANLVWLTRREKVISWIQDTHNSASLYSALANFSLTIITKMLNCRQVLHSYELLLLVTHSIININRVEKIILINFLYRRLRVKICLPLRHVRNRTDKLNFGQSHINRMSSISIAAEG